MNPNSQHQLWSQWDFEVCEVGRHVSRSDVEYNASVWLRQGFGTAGCVRVRRTVVGWLIEARIEGRPAHDPEYVASVRRSFQRQFVAKGWGPLAYGRVEARILAGDRQDGRPPDQMIGMPPLRVPLDVEVK